MFHLVRQYTRWLHTGWPAGTVEKLPIVQPDGTTNVPGLFIVGDLAGIPLLKFSADTGARAVRRIHADAEFQKRRTSTAPPGAQAAAAPLDVLIIGAGVAGLAAALEARKLGLRFAIVESSEPLSTLVNFPARKPIYTYPTEMTPAGELTLTATVKEALIDELRAQTIERGIEPRRARVEFVRRAGAELVAVVADGPPIRALRVIVAIGRSGEFRRLGIAGEELPKVYNRLHDPHDFAGQQVLVVGGGDSALEAAIALADSGASVTLSYRNAEFTRPKPENAAGLQARPQIRILLGSRVERIGERSVSIRDAGGQSIDLPNDAVFTMIGRSAPLDFLRRSGVAIAGEMTARSWALFAAFMAFCVFLYHWKKSRAELPIYQWFENRRWFPFNVPDLWAAFGDAAQQTGHILHVLANATKQPGFYYTLAYCLCVVIFGLQRIRRRKTPYVRLQTYTLMAIQCVPLFVLPEIVLPWAGENGWFSGGGLGGWIGANLFPNGEYWRAYGLILAWPLFIYNVFTEQPLTAWLVISFVQTFVLIPLLIYYYGKGAYCGWICSCGALAETLGDAHRHKMPHGKFWNRLNMVGQVVLAFVTLLLLLRVAAWIAPGTPIADVYRALLGRLPFVNYEYLVDLVMAGILGVGCYFWFSGRVWCRFACPLAALMHIYARFSRFRILADKKKCISCNVCTSVCHQGIDVMSFANRGLPMADVECVRCSACVQMCPTGVLSFGQVDPKTGQVIGRDRLTASLVQLTENGKPIRR